MALNFTDKLNFNKQFLAIITYLDESPLKTKRSVKNVKKLNPEPNFFYDSSTVIAR